MCCSILAHIFDALKTLVQLTRHLLEKTLLFHAYEFKNKPRKTKNVLTSMHWHLIQFMSTQLRMDFYEFKELISVACYLDLKSFIILWAKIKYTTIMQLKRLVIMAKVLTVLYNLYVIGFCSTTPRMKMWYMCSGMWPRISHLWLYCISLLKLFFFFWQRMTRFKNALWVSTFWAIQTIFIMSENVKNLHPVKSTYIAWDNNWHLITFSSLPFLHIKSWVKFTLMYHMKRVGEWHFWTYLCPWTNV